MAEIFGALKSGLDLSPFDIDNLSEYQLQQVILGLRAGVDVCSYADPSNDNMFEDRVKLVRECVGNALASGENVTQQQLNIIAHYKNDGLDTTAWENYKFDRDRLEQIVKGLEKHVDVDVFAKPKFSKEQMYEIRHGLMEDCDVSVYATTDFNAEQMCEIRKGLRIGLDVKPYATTDFDMHQMYEIRQAIKEGSEVSLLANPEFDFQQMRQIRKGLAEKLDVSVYANPEFSADKMYYLYRGMSEGFDMAKYVDFNEDQLKRIVAGLFEALEVCKKKYGITN